MKRFNRLLTQLVLGIFACTVIISLGLSWSQPSTAQSTLIPYPEEGILLAQSMGTPAKKYSAVMTGSGIFPNAVTSDASGAVGAVLIGNRFLVRGDFRNLSSQLRDYAADPVSPPNPNITSASHIHRGTPAENGPFQYAFTVTLNPDNVSGTLKGEFTLTDEQLQALNNGNLYADLHTKGFRAGEIRGAFKANA